MMNPNGGMGGGGAMLPGAAPGGQDVMGQRRKWLMGQLANQQAVGGQPGVGRMPTMDEQQAAGQAGRQASPPRPQNPMAPDMGQMGQEMRQAAMAPMMRPNPAPAMPSMYEMSGMGNNRAAGASMPGMMQGGGQPGRAPQQPGQPGQPQMGRQWPPPRR